MPWLLFATEVERIAAQLLTGSEFEIGVAGTTLLALDTFLPVPSSVVATAMGALLGAAGGTLVNTLGLTLGCLLGYLAGRAGQPLARRLLGLKAEAFERWVARYGLFALVLCRAVPVLAEASVIALGAGRARLLPLLGAALAVDLSLGALYAFAGAATGPAGAPALPGLAAATLIPALATLAAWLAIRHTRSE